MIVNNDIKNANMTMSRTMFFLYFVSLILFTSLIALIISNTIWPAYTTLIHVGFELTCIFISLCIFGVIWAFSDFNKILHSHRIIGYGLLIVVILEIFHLSTIQQTSLNLSIRYWLEARMVEGIVLLIATCSLLQRITNKILLFLLSITIAICIVVLNQFALFPLTLNVGNYAVSTIKFVSYIIIVVYIIAFLNLHFVCTKKNKSIDHPYLFFSLLLFIFSSLSYTLSANPLPFYIVFGHILKLIAYFLLIKGIFIASILYPYQILESSRKDLTAILDELPMGIIQYDKDAKTSFVNQQTLNLLECTQSDINQMTMEQMYIKFKIVDDISHEMKKLETLKGNQLIYKTSDLFFDNGKITTIHDVRIEQELHNFNIHTHTILNAISNQIIILDKNHMIIDCNDSFLEFMEIDKNFIIGMSIYDYNDLIKLKYNNKDFRTIELLRDNFNEYTLITPKGKSKTVMSQYKQIEDVYGEIIGYVSIAADFTDLKDEQKKLQNQERLALIGQMGSGIVHETKNYLASIKGYCELLFTNITDERKKSYVSKIQFLANDMNGLVTEYLNLSKPTEIILDILSLNELIHSIKYILESPSFLMDSRLIIDLCETDIEVLADEPRMKQVVINLAKNSVEAMKGIDNACLTIQTKCTDHFMYILISDNGVGINPENLKKLGTPFFTTKPTGTGLGLSSCYKIIEDCGGQVFVDSEIGKGTTFTIELPVYEDEKISLETISIEEA